MDTVHNGESSGSPYNIEKYSGTYLRLGSSSRSRQTENHATLGYDGIDRFQKLGGSAIAQKRRLSAIDSATRQFSGKTAVNAYRIGKIREKGLTERQISFFENVPASFWNYDADYITNITAPDAGFAVSIFLRLRDRAVLIEPGPAVELSQRSFRRAPGNS